VAVLPWDSEHFGFGVGDYAPGEARAVSADRRSFLEALGSWAKANGVELISGRAEAADARWRLLLAELGFEFIDCSLDVVLEHLPRLDVPKPRHPIRRAVREDFPGLLRIAEHALELDRYHADPRFPGGLAALRHRRWMENILADDRPGARTYVTGEPGRPAGFVSLVFEKEVAALILAAVDPARHGQGIGKSLFAGMLQASIAEGATSCTGKLYSANGPIMNVFAHLGFRFTRSLALFHWHAPEAPHLVNPARIWA
jgi:GNAT superfamily N-acetyltransferase